MHTCSRCVWCCNANAVQRSLVECLSNVCLQVMPPLYLGGLLVIAKSGGHMDPGYVATLIRQHRITSMMFTVPTLVSWAGGLELRTSDSV